MPQGDPFSSWAFAVVLQSAMQTFLDMMHSQGMEEGRDYTTGAYVDDVVLTGPATTLPALVAAWKEALGPLGLELQDKKMQIFQQGATPQQMADMFGCDPSQRSGEGLILCGLPLSPGAEHDSMIESPMELPIGTIAFQQKYLQARLQTLTAKTRVLQGIAEGLPHRGRHIALDLLHRSLLASCVYLLRALHVNATLPWATACDELFQQTWLHICGIPRLSDGQWHLVTAAPAWGGFGLQRMMTEAPLHALSQALAIRALRCFQSQPNGPWNHAERAALDQCQASFEVTTILQRSEGQLEREGYMRAMRRLRSGRPLPEGVSPVDVSKRLFIDSPSHATSPSVDITERQQRAASVVWYTQPGGCHLQNDVLIAGVRDRLELPVFREGMVCDYITRSSNRACCTPLDQLGFHSNKCCHALVQARHHALRDWVRQTLISVGDHATLEQNILVRQGPQIENGASQELWHRADVAGVSPCGQRTLYDIAVVSTPSGGSARGDTNKVEVAKFSMYGASHGKCHNAIGDFIQPVVFHVTAGLGHTAQSFCWQIAGKKMEVAARTGQDLSQALMTRIQIFFSLCAEALRIVREGQYRVLRASSSMAWQ